MNKTINKWKKFTTVEPWIPAILTWHLSWVGEKWYLHNYKRHLPKKKKGWDYCPVPKHSSKGCLLKERKQFFCNSLWEVCFNAIPDIKLSFMSHFGRVVRQMVTPWVLAGTFIADCIKGYCCDIYYWHIYQIAALAVIFIVSSYIYIYIYLGQFLPQMNWMEKIFKVLNAIILKFKRCFA